MTHTSAGHQDSAAAALQTIIGLAAVVLFAAIYAVEMWPHDRMPAAIAFLQKRLGSGGFVFLNIYMVGAFLLLLPYRVPSRGLWKSHGAFLGFTIALMTEMFGWPLLLLILSPLVDVPIIAYPYMKALGHNGPAGIGTAVSLAGLALVVAGWAKIHRAEGLVTTGIYRWVRHPQYTGLMLFTFGWLIHWPSLITLLLWPLLSAAYVALALAEEREAALRFGADYRAYADATPRRFLPFIV